MYLLPPGDRPCRHRGTPPATAGKIRQWPCADNPRIDGGSACSPGKSVRAIYTAPILHAFFDRNLIKKNAIFHLNDVFLIKFQVKIDVFWIKKPFKIEILA